MWCGSLHLSLSLSLFGEGWVEGAGPWNLSLLLHENSPFPLKTHTHTHTHKGNTHPNTQAHMQRNHTHIQQAPPLQISCPALSGKERNHHSGTVNYSKQWRYPWQPNQKLFPVGCLSRVVCFCQSCMFNLCLENIMWDMHRVCVCLTVACHLHFWQNDLGLLHATAVTWWWNGYWSQSTESWPWRRFFLSRLFNYESCSLPLRYPGLQICWKIMFLMQNKPHTIVRCHTYTIILY